jgi:hypothetical protein
MTTPDSLPRSSCARARALAQRAGGENPANKKFFLRFNHAAKVRCEFVRQRNKFRAMAP